jgi:hypothetical protein
VASTFLLVVRVSFVGEVEEEALTWEEDEEGS